MYILNCGTLLCIIVAKQQVQDILHSLEYEPRWQALSAFVVQFNLEVHCTCTCSIRPCNFSMGFLPPDVDRPYMYVLVMTRSVGEYLILLNVYIAKLYN